MCPSCSSHMKMTSQHPILVPSSQITADTLKQPVKFRLPSTALAASARLAEMLPTAVDCGKTRAVAQACINELKDDLRSGRLLLALVSQGPSINATALAEDATQLAKALQMSECPSMDLMRRIGDQHQTLRQHLQHVHSQFVPVMDQSGQMEPHVQRAMACWREYRSHSRSSMEHHLTALGVGTACRQVVMGFVRNDAILMSMQQGNSASMSLVSLLHNMLSEMNTPRLKSP